MNNLQDILKNTRESKGLLLREVAALIDTDTALISKFEKGERRPTREQLEKYAKALDIEFSDLIALWLSEKVYQEVKEEDTALDALKMVIKRIRGNKE